VAEYLIEKYQRSPGTSQERRIHHLLQNRQIWFVPMVNPDGHMHTITRDREWRANRASYALPAGTITAPRLGGGSRSISVSAGTYIGVDINRNYPTTTWGQETFDSGFVTTSQDPLDGGANSVWCGRGGASELETQAVVRLTARHGFRASITYHSFSQLLLYPDSASSHSFVQLVGTGMRDLINAHGNPYTYQSGSALYPTTGDLMDYSYEASPGRPTFTPELRPTEADPNSWAFSALPESEIEPCFLENLGAALALINCAGHALPAGTVCSPATRRPSRTCQVVRNCWQVFRGWRP